ncbi:MAG: glycosyltransferase [Hydrogenophaga sp.]|uniref:glycosyltransferase family 4 protein n=1 Tax=Hydrogenophaga sp. TaxID=1904254 RepID=UPI00169FEF5B|nr:glycosyltransferase family 4 protein [Hydrogenophaga sp.]NIM39981.1 glycosyltransferase [Hydrogenophaga sp.]NIN25177.1 glycosyltransferase [Hydrogenophaga sp.]NIN29744.1 glycosyltransferase [Hydrogenophaga sp.]NIN54216.1 glycosyltransferase [Hydrogenophaga sp.]NIO50629.1 glycosyltransferase [Hydrogenophaga sp.]
MKLLIVSQYCWPEVFGINALAQALAQRGVKVTVLTGQPNYPEGRVFPHYRATGLTRETLGDVDILRVPLAPRGQGGVRLALNYLSFILAAGLLGPWVLRGRSFDAVLVYAPSPLLQALPAIPIAWLKRAPLAVWVQDLWPESLSATGFIRNQRVLAAVRHVVRYIYRHTDSILIPSEAFREPIAALAPAPARIHYYPNAWTAESGAAQVSESARQLAAEMAQGFSVAFTGNLGTAQALDAVIDAARQLQAIGSPVRLYLIGSGSLSDWLAQQVREHSLRNVSLPGRFAQSDIPALLAASSAVLLTLRDEPIFAYTVPSKLQAYLAAGRPIIAAINGEAARLVREADAGLSCPAGDATALAKAVQAMHGLDEGRRAAMGDNAGRYAAAHFSLPQLTDDLIEHLRHLTMQHADHPQENSR